MPPSIESEIVAFNCSRRWFVTFLLLLVVTEATGTAIAISHYIREYFNNYTLFTHEDRYSFLPHLSKRSYSNSIRFVFFAGVGGVGHHVIEQVFHKCGMNCGETTDITGLLWNSNFNSLFVFQNETVLLDVSRQIIHHYHDHNNITTSLAKPSKYYFLNCNNGYSMLSYPRYFTSQNMYEPNVHILVRNTC